MAKKSDGRAGSPMPTARSRPVDGAQGTARPTKRPSALVDTRVIYCGDNPEQLNKLPGTCVDLIYTDPPFNSNRSDEVFGDETKEKGAFDTAMRRSKCDKVFFVSFDCSDEALHAIDRFFKADHAVIIPLTVKEILDEQIVKNLA